MGCKLLETWDTGIELEWRNRQTHGTQNPAPFTGHESSTLSSSTSYTNHCNCLRALPSVSFEIACAAARTDILHGPDRAQVATPSPVRGIPPTLALGMNEGGER